MMRMFGIWRVTYGRKGLRLLGRSAIAVPLTLLSVWRTRRSATAVLRALLAVPVAMVSSALAAITAYVVVINVLAYPFRPYLGFGGSRADIWAARWAGVGGVNVLWAPHTLASGAALTITLAPLVALILVSRTGWWRAEARRAR